LLFSVNSPHRANGCAARASPGARIKGGASAGWHHQTWRDSRPFTRPTVRRPSCASRCALFLCCARSASVETTFCVSLHIGSTSV
jgi:hypothetical protein